MTTNQPNPEAVEAAARAIRLRPALLSVTASSTTRRPEASRTLARAALEAALPLLPVLPDPKGGCVCTWHSEDRGGGTFETVAEYEPACPEHSEHVYNPRTGVWVLPGRTEAQVKAEAWAEGYTSGYSRAMRCMSDEPNVPHAANPYRERGES